MYGVQARAEELADHEEQLEAWKQKFKAEALRQISEREKALSDWQAKLDRKKTDLEELQRSVEVRHLCQQARALLCLMMPVLRRGQCWLNTHCPVEGTKFGMPTEGVARHDSIPAGGC